MHRHEASHVQLSRRALLAGSVAGIAAYAAAPLALAQTGSPTPGGGLTTGDAYTWLLASPDELRPDAPGDLSPDELAELVQLQATRDDAAIALIKQWNSRPAVLPWTETANAALAEFKMSSVRQSRAQGMLQAAMSDAVLAAYDAQDAYHTALPATLNSQITPLEGIVAERPAFPSEHAVVAGAAATVLAGLLPDAAPGRFADLANSVAMTRLQAGLNTRRDIEAGLALGQAIGERALAHGADDATQADWDGTGRLEGPGYWQPTPPAFVEAPLEPLAGTWKLWVLETPDQFPAPPPPAYDSPGWQSQLAAVQQAVADRSFTQAEHARYWQNTSATMLWNGFATDLITRNGLDLPQAARVLALMAVAQADAQVANYAAKYTYWTERPITADPELAVLFPTPPFPSFPSSHSTVSNAAAVVLSSLFPDDAADLLDLAEEAAMSRCWAGIHYPNDNDGGTALGREIGYLVANVGHTSARARGALSGYAAIEALRAEPAQS